MFEVYCKKKTSFKKHVLFKIKKKKKDAVTESPLWKLKPDVKVQLRKSVRKTTLDVFFLFWHKYFVGFYGAVKGDDGGV